MISLLKCVFTVCLKGDNLMGQVQSYSTAETDEFFYDKETSVHTRQQPIICEANSILA